MIIQLPRNLHFPITITAFLKQPDDEVPRLSPLLRYTYRTTVTEYPEFGEELEVEKELSAMFNAPVEGRLERWMVSIGTVIKGAKFVLPSHSLSSLLPGLVRALVLIFRLGWGRGVVLISWKLRSLAHMKFSLLDCVLCVGRI